MIEKCLNITILDFSNFDNLLQKGHFICIITHLKKFFFASLCFRLLHLCTDPFNNDVICGKTPKSVSFVRNEFSTR